MIDLKYVRANVDAYKENIKNRCLDVDLDAFLEMDKKVIELNQKIDEIKATKNSFSKTMGKLSPEERTAKLEELKVMGETQTSLEDELKILEEKYNNVLYRLPNVLDPTASLGETDEDNACVFKYKEPTKFDFTPVPHYVIGEKKGWIDLEKGSEVSGSRFFYLKGDAVFLQFAIVSYAVSKLASKGFCPILPPVLVREKAMFGTGFLPAGEDGTYRVNPEDDDLYLVGTAEVPVTSYHSNEIIDDLSSPIKYVGYSPCFRKEAGSAGKDTRGILRVHQFDKVEMVCFCKPEDSQKLHDEMVAVEEDIRQGLGIPYQKVNVCSGDLGNPAMKKYDLEAWMPGQEKYREVTSCSNIGEYQSRRLGIRYRDDENKPQYVHTLNGTVIALSRCIMAIMENYQTADGDIIVPEVLRPFMGGKELI